jgi:hypothetical protein
MAEPGPRQVFNSVITRIAFTKSGTWCSLGLTLNNLGVGGDASIEINFQASLGIDPFTISLGVNGDFNPTFWDVRLNGFDVSVDHFNQEVTLSNGKKMQAFGYANFDLGDSHNGSWYFFKAPGTELDATVFANSNVATPPNANIFAKATFDRFDPMANPVLSSANGLSFADASFHFNLTKGEEEVVLV